MSETESPVQGLQLSNGVYNKGKFLVQIVLPAFIVLYSTLSEIWQFPKVQEVVGSLGAIGLFLGVILGISTSSYRKSAEKASGGTPVGSFVVRENVDGKKTVRLELEQDPEQFIGQDNIVFKLEKEDIAPEEDGRE